MIRPLAIAAVLLALAGGQAWAGKRPSGGLCSAPQCICPTSASAAACQKGGGSSPSPIANLQQFTVTDLQAALADAQSRTPPDTRHGKCWAALIPIAQQFQPPIHPPSAPGAAELIQTFFDAEAAANQPLVPDSALEACSETVFDLQIDFARLVAMVGGQAIPPIKPPFLAR
jgi:hypothetical protein